MNKNSKTWIEIATEIQGKILETEISQGACSVMLTGGRSAEFLYESWSKLNELRFLNKTNFYFGDERCVSKESLDSNFGLAMRTLFKSGVPRGCKIHRIEADLEDKDLAALKYEKLLPKNIDILILTVGEDGHIASLFPMSTALQESTRRVLAVNTLSNPRQRITITPPLILSSKNIFVLAIGSSKVKIYEKIMNETIDSLKLPAKIVRHARWFCGEIN